MAQKHERFYGLFVRRWVEADDGDVAHWRQQRISGYGDENFAPFTDYAEAQAAAKRLRASTGERIIVRRLLVIYHLRLGGSK